MAWVVLVSDEKTEALEACAAAFDTPPEWLPVEAQYVRKLIDSTDPRALVLCCPDALQLDPVVRDTLAEAIVWPWPGFGEALRRQLPSPLSLLTEVVAGATAEGRVVVALPASPQASTAARALLPLVEDALEKRSAGQPLVAADADTSEQAELIVEPEAVEDVPAGGGLSVEAIGAGGAPPETEAGPWQAALAARGGVLNRDRWYALPDALEEVAAAREVLEGAGERAVVAMPDGREIGAFGFPDLRRPSSKVLLVAMTRGVLEVAALHRHPSAVGIVGRATILKADDTEEEARRRTGLPTPYGGMLFAVDHKTVYIERDGQVYRWDGSREHDEGSEAQATASLLLRWSSR